MSGDVNMAQTFVKIQAKLLREYYKDFSKYARGRKPENKVAWVTAFTPIELLEALDIDYYYPESYAAVIAASNMEQGFIEKSEENFLSRDCCSYSCCFNGALDSNDGPRGIPPKPDILIATNNQCNTLPNWWNTLAKRYDVPLVVLDYPGEIENKQRALEYVTQQHKELVHILERLSGNRFDENCAVEIVQNSKMSVQAWERVSKFLSSRNVAPTLFFDNINFLITARCKMETSEMYELLANALEEENELVVDKIRLFWLGYPLWYHKDRYPSELLHDFQIVGSNYITWWNLDYSGFNLWEELFNAYNYTFLNLTQASRDRKLTETILKSNAQCAVTLHNKSCKCDYVSAKNIDIPQVELEIDMIDRNYLDANNAQRKIELLKGTICTE